jgi:hypothetical protein
MRDMVSEWLMQRARHCPKPDGTAILMANAPLPRPFDDEPNCNESWIRLMAKFGKTSDAVGRPRTGDVTPMGWAFDSVGHLLARYLDKPEYGYEPFTPSEADTLRAVLRPGDVLLVEGNNHISGVIKYLTQSTWSHAALYCGPIGDRVTADGEPLVLVEANIGQGVIAAPLSKYVHYHTRICRPSGLTIDDCMRVCTYACERIGFDYDVKNILDLLRYLFPLPVPQRWRRRMMSLGSGHPTRIICSALIAQAFENVRYPILPKVTKAESRAARREILEIRHSSLFAPRDFDISPYFEVVKPTLVKGFDYKSVSWADQPVSMPEPEVAAA